MNLNDLQLRELQRFAELGRLSATLIHEISNPLAAALLNLELSDQTSPGVRRARRNMQVLRRYVEAARHQLRTHNHQKYFAVTPQFCHLKRILLPLAKQAGVGLEFSQLPVQCKLRGNPSKFQQIVANLIINAIQSYGSPGAGRRVVKVTVSSNQSQLRIEVRDWGKGIGSRDLPKIFEPFYTTKGSGLGLGLPIVKRHVTEDFRGTITVSSRLGEGTTFMVRLPR